MSMNTSIGAGAGAGIPTVQPQRPIYLVEPVGKKVAFLRQSVLTLGLKNATVLSGKIEDLERLLRADPVFRKGRDEAPSTPQAGTETPSPAPTSTALSASTEKMKLLTIQIWSMLFLILCLMGSGCRKGERSPSVTQERSSFSR